MGRERRGKEERKGSVVGRVRGRKREEKRVRKGNRGGRVRKVKDKRDGCVGRE